MDKQSRCCSFAKTETSLATDNLDIADVFDHIPCTGITPYRGSHMALARSGCTPERTADSKNRSRTVAMSTAMPPVDEMNVNHPLSRQGAGRLNFNTAKSLCIDR
jgi:hypothetical protein